MPKNNPGGYSNMGGMKMHQSDLQAPKSVYSQGFDNATLNVVKRDNQARSKQAAKLRGQEYKGRYQ